MNLEGRLHTIDNTDSAKLPWLVVVILLIILAAKVIVTIYLADKGFDLTDEGCYMLWYKYPEADPHPFYYFHKIILGFFPFIDWNIISLRLLKMASDLSIVALVTLVIYRNIQLGAQQWRSGLFLLGVAGLGYYSLIYSRIFYEGDMSYLFTVCSLGFPLLFIQPRYQDRLWVGLLLSGIVIGLLFFNKFSSAIISLLWVLAFTVYLTRKARSVFVVFGGVAIGVAAFFLATGYLPAAWYQEYFDGYRYVIQPLGYNPFHLLLYYAIDGLILLTLALLPIGFFVLVRRFFRKQPWWKYPYLTFTIVVAVFFATYYGLLPHIYSDAHYHHHSMLFQYWYAPIVSVVLFVFFTVRHITASKEEITVLLTLLLMPMITLVGTGTSFSIAASAYLIPWFGVLGWMLLIHFRKQWLPAFAIMVMVSLGAFWYFHWYSPFRLNNNMASQQTLLQAPNEEINVDVQLALFVTETQAILTKANIPSGYPIVALHNLPGLVYLLGGYSPATPWYFDVGWLNQKDFETVINAANCTHISRIELFESRLPVFIINKFMLSTVQPCLDEHGYNLAQSYQQPQMVLNPYLQQENRVLNRDFSDSTMVWIPISF